MSRKNPAATATTKRDAARLLGSLGGARNTPAQKAARAANRNRNGRPPVYRLTKAGELQKRHGDRWLTIDELDVNARRWLRTHRR